MATRLYAPAAAAAAAFAFLCNPPAPEEQTTPRATARAAAAPGACPGRAIKPDRVITGEFGTELSQSYVMVPFEVPSGTTAVRVKYCYDQPDAPVSTPAASARHTLDLGLYEPREDRSRTWGGDEFRGWGGSSHPDVTVSPEGFSTEAEYLAQPRVDPPGKTTRAFRPGPIEPGQWAAELGVAGVVPQSLGDADGKVAWRVEVELSRSPAQADEPYRPARYDPTPAKSRPGWYAGDMHVHGEHSALGDATMREVFDFAFKPLAQGGAGLDFITLSDYVSGGSWGEIGRHQNRYPGKLVARSAEVITYRGHLNNQHTTKIVDYREGPIFERAANGSLNQVRGRRPASRSFAEIRAAGGYTQINHPTIFPSSVPLFDLACRGCSWEYNGPETRYDLTNAIEVATGPSGLKAPGSPGPNPFTATAIDFYERALQTGAKVAAVGVSDSHNAGRTNNPVTQSPIGEATTIVRAEELSEPGIECGVEAGHTYVKVTGNAGPDIRFEAKPPGFNGPPAIMGDTVRAPSASFTARVLGGAGRSLVVLRNGEPFTTVPVSSGDFATTFSAAQPGRYRLQVQREQTIETISSPIYLEPGPGPGKVETRECAPLKVTGKAKPRLRASRKGQFLTRCTASGAGLRECTVRATIRVRRRGRLTARTLGTGAVQMSPGSRQVRVKLNRAGRRVLRRHRRGRRVRLDFVVSDGDGARASDRRATRLLRARGRRGK